MKVFITGASGFAGGALTRYFAERGDTVIAMSRSDASDQVIRELKATPVRCSLGNVSSAALHGCDLIVHAAAYVEEWGPYEMYHTANVEGTQQLLRTAKEAGVKRFLQISTEAVLFHGRDLINVDERTAYPDTTFYYPLTKQLAEKAVIAANEPGVFETLILRPRTIWGPGDKTILPILKEKIAANQFMWINKGKYSISTTHISNLVEGVARIIEKGKAGEIYFITDGETISLYEFFTQLMATQGIRIPAKSLPKWLVRGMATVTEFVWKLFRIKKQPPITRFAASILSIHCTINDAKARNELGYVPVISIKEGMRELKQIADG